jgi:hypothetical protein
VPLPTYVTAPKAPPRRIDIPSGRAWTENTVDVDDEPTQEFPVLTDELIAQIEAEMLEKTEKAAAEAASAGLQLDRDAQIVEIEHKRAVGE